MEKYKAIQVCFGKIILPWYVLGKCDMPEIRLVVTKGKLRLLLLRDNQHSYIHYTVNLTS